MNKPTSSLLALVLLALPVAALAHPGHAGHAGYGFIDGFSHPFLGLDHLLAMLLVGIWSVLHARQVWLAPLSFVIFLALGALLGQQGVALPHLEPLVAASVLGLGLMLTVPFRDHQALALLAQLAIAAFALCHGLAHGGELANGTPVLAGIVLGSALLHALGMAFAYGCLRGRLALAKHLGQLAAVVGGGLLLTAVI